MAWHNCPKCGNLRKIDNVISSDGWHQPPCYHCGDPGYLEPFEEDENDYEVVDFLVDPYRLAVIDPLESFPKSLIVMIFEDGTTTVADLTTPIFHEVRKEL